MGPGGGGGAYKVLLLLAKPLVGPLGKQVRVDLDQLGEADKEKPYWQLSCPPFFYFITIEE